MAGFGDKLKNIFTVDYDDDYDDDYYDDYDDYDDNNDIDNSKDMDADDIPVRHRQRREESTFAREETTPRESSKRTRTSSYSQSKNTKFTRSTKGSKVVPMKSGDMEVCVMKPTHHENIKNVIDTLLEGKAVILNLEGIKLDLAQRIVDSVSGGCYAIKGNLQKISGYIYLVTPSSVEITGDFQDMIDNDGSYTNPSSGRRY